MTSPGAMGKKKLVANVPKAFLRVLAGPGGPCCSRVDFGRLVLKNFSNVRFGCGVVNVIPSRKVSARAYFTKNLSLLPSSC